MKITTTRKLKDKETQRILKLETIMESMKKEAKNGFISKLCEVVKNHPAYNPNEEIKKLSQVIFASVFDNKDNSSVFKTYNGLVLITITRLKNIKEAISVRQKAVNLPQTMAAFIGTTGRMVNIIIPFRRPDGSLPQTQEEAEVFHAHAY